MISLLLAPIKLLLAPIKQYAYLFLAGTLMVTIAGLAYEIRHKILLEGEAIVRKDFVEYQKEIADEVAANEKRKQEIENENAENTKLLAQNYNNQLVDLNRRLLQSNVQNVSRGENLPVAGTINPTSGVPATNSTSGRVDATFALKPPVALRIDPNDALRDTLQCENLQKWISNIYLNTKE